ncbi:SHOCT domain-containing protein [Nocardioides sp. zg-536]|uniref:SHOCT domain-containing protein n=1 Tax=Nocardioides faecalis TaxID=2803858 RepID=A0A938Y422_9ACTN|nr:SHOCT domain-containing protein [Nocardioides faecalis]MBM9458864.1 SHOCT domain-containing protein [Nocardioides faecalis]QVI60270.1 SHOCT domain-containing protein [Nocardioides faecalis]
MANLANERFFSAQPDWVFEALTRALRGLRWSIKSTDQYSRSVTFSTPMSGFSWGASMSASVIPSPEGGLVRVGGAAKLRTNVTAGGAERKNIGRLLDAASRELQAMLAQDPSGVVPSSHQAEGQQVGGLAIADQLTKLVTLHEAGKLSDAEFDAAKAKLLS